MNTIQPQRRLRRSDKLLLWAASFAVLALVFGVMAVAMASMFPVIPMTLCLIGWTSFYTWYLVALGRGK